MSPVFLGPDVDVDVDWNFLSDSVQIYKICTGISTFLLLAWQIKKINITTHIVINYN